MSDACTLPRAAETQRKRWFDASMLDIAECSRLEIDVTLYEHESAGLRVETWPVAIQNLLDRHVADWRARHPDVTVTAITCGVEKGRCVLILHYREKAA